MTDNLTPEQERENYRQAALRALTNEYISNLAAVSFSKPEPGEIPKYGTIFDGLYKKTTDQAPNQDAYEILWKKLIQSEDGTINKQRLIKLAGSAVAQAVTRLKINDILQLVGTDTQVKPEYDDKYVAELDLSDEEAQEVVGAYFTYLTNKKAEMFLANTRNQLVGGLEQKFCETNE